MFSVGGKKQTEFETKQELRDGDDAQRLEVMQRILPKLCTHGDYLRLYPEVVKIMGTPNLELKRLCYIYLVLATQLLTSKHPQTVTSLRTSLSDSQTATNAFTSANVGVQDEAEAPPPYEKTLALLTINGFQKDASHRHHIVRAWAIKAMGSLHMTEAIPPFLASLRRGAADGSPFVRQIVAQACPKIVALDRTLTGFVVSSILMRLTGDIEDTVVAAALQSLYRICLQLPQLLSVNPQDILACRAALNLYPHPPPSFEDHADEKSSSSELGHTGEQPFLACLHSVFCRIVGNVLERLPFYGQVCGIYLLTQYCRSFFYADIAARKSSGHFQLYLSKLAYLVRRTNSPAVFIAAAVALRTLAPDPDRSQLLDETIPYVLHHLQTSPPEFAAELIMLLAELSTERPDTALRAGALAATTLQYHDTGDVLGAKLSLQMALCVVPEFPLERVCEDLLATVFWSNRGGHWITHSAGEGKPDVFAHIPQLLACRLKRKPTHLVDLEAILDSLFSLATSAHSSNLAEGAIGALSRIASSSKALSPKRLRSILLVVARRLAAVLGESQETGAIGSSAGLASAIGLLARHHAAAPKIALDAFRVLVACICQRLLHQRGSCLEPTAIHHVDSSGVGPELEIAVLNFGATLWAHYVVPSLAPVNPSTKDIVNDTARAKLVRIWEFLVETLRAKSVHAIVRDLAFLTSRLCATPEEGNLSEVTAQILRTTLCGVFEAPTDLDPKLSHNESGTLGDVWQGLQTSAGSAHLLKLPGEQYFFPDFVSPADQLTLRRFVASDAFRDPPTRSSNEENFSSLATIAKGSNTQRLLQSAPGTTGGSEDDDALDNFYKSTDGWNTMPMGTASGDNNTSDPLAALFGSDPQRGGVIVFGEDIETDDEEDQPDTELDAKQTVPQRQSNGLPSTEPTNLPNHVETLEDDAEEEADWLQIQQQLSAAQDPASAPQ